MKLIKGRLYKIFFHDGYMTVYDASNKFRGEVNNYLDINPGVIVPKGSEFTI